MVNPVRKPASYQDVLEAPENMIAELVDGVLHLTTRPGIPHTVAASRILGMLDPLCGTGGGGGPGGWHVLFEPELHMDDDILVPDVAAWRIERLPEMSDAAYFTLAPDWLCEVLSRSTGAIDRTAKLPIYARAGVQTVWLIDAQQRTLEVLRLERGRWRTIAVHRENEQFRAEPFASLELDLGRLWAYVVPTPRGPRASEPAGAPYAP